MSLGIVRFSSRDIPDSRRASRYGEALNSVLGLEVTSLDDAPLDVETVMRLLPGGLVVARSDLSPLSMNRTAAHIADGNDNFILSVPISGKAAYRLGAREVVCGRGDAFFFPGDEPSLIANHKMSRLSLSIPRKLLESTMPASTSLAPQSLRHSAALALLSDYAKALTQETFDPSSGLEALAAGHIRDLVAMALDPTAARPEMTEQPGIRAARLRAIKEDVRFNLHRHDVSLDHVARRHRISPRYVQLLFRDEATTFREFVLGERLERAHAQLCNAQFAAAPIGEIAYACGFGDLSYFNQAFRRRYGMTPSEVRRTLRG
ncbi:MAG: AraC family transcriptional regulator [Pseudolabrys sp.]|nr:AraC family transcriptional regulator [Pseudolabrys sp.]MDP2295524.1 AraC family transcriptional regulator [Pseudolabrys sp.]